MMQAQEKLQVDSQCENKYDCIAGPWLTHKILYFQCNSIIQELFTISETFSNSGDSLHRETIMPLIQAIVSFGKKKSVYCHMLKKN